MSTDGFNIPAFAAQPYAASGQGRRLRAWRVPAVGPNTVTVAGLSTLRSRARGAARNDVWAGTALDKLTSNGIGTGIQAKPQWGTAEFKAATKKLWKRWVKMCDADGALNFDAMQGLAWREWHEAGEIFVRLRQRRDSDGLPVPLQLQLIESEQCPCELYTTASNGNAVRAGIEFDGIGRRRAYWMYRSHPGDMTTGGINGHELVRVPAEQVLHLYEPLRAGQLRGIPRASSALIRMFNLDSLDDAVLERQKIANLFAGFFVPAEQGDGDGPGLQGPVEDLTSGSAPDSDGMPLAGLEPGTMQELPAGMDVKFSEPPDAGSNYADFTRGHLMAIAARHGVPYEVLTGDLRNVSDRALRLILNEFRRIIEMWQWHFMIPQFCQPIREAWFDAAVLSGALTIEGYADPSLREDAVETLWVTQGWPYSHPVQDVNSDKIAIRSGLKTRAQTILANGDDPDEIDAELAADQQRADDLGLVLDVDARKTSNTGITQSRPSGNALPSTDI